MSQRVYLEESASLRAHTVALHVFAAASAGLSKNAMKIAKGAADDVERSVAEAFILQQRAVPGRREEAQDSLNVALKRQEAVLEANLLFWDQLAVYRQWMGEKIQEANFAVLQGLCLFTGGPEEEDEPDEECSEEECIPELYITVEVPDDSEIPSCDSVEEAIERLSEEIHPALRQLREEFDLSWQNARGDWLDGGAETAESYESNHYSELDRASAGFEQALERLIENLEAAVEG